MEVVGIETTLWTLEFTDWGDIYQHFLAVDFFDAISFKGTLSLTDMEKVSCSLAVLADKSRKKA